MSDAPQVDGAFWLERWREGQIGFHQSTPSPLLVECWDGIGVAPDARVYVPLAGKSVDMPWLAARGHRVFGVELSPLAVEQFFAEQGLKPQVEHTPKGVLSHAGSIDVLCGDVFALEEGDLADCNAFFDRAALFACQVADLEHAVDKEPQASLGRDAARARVRRVEQAQLLQVRHDVSDRGGR